ncbi:uncharacterized protein G2W53_023577 [Senna tora]|uniref:Uncharacterized protein n=1 Tax=Senna tora TaxID=362788 RepID=A0A834WD36_9FABA|nr:uncharacterized protein G2W53_023577 [Senna tora]
MDVIGLRQPNPESPMWHPLLQAWKNLVSTKHGFISTEPNASGRRSG